MKALLKQFAKKLLLIICLADHLNVKAQFVKVVSNTTASLIDLSVIKKGTTTDILIGGDSNYLVGSSDSCNTLFSLSAGPIGEQQRICRVDSGHIFEVVYSNVQSQFSTSYNGGLNFSFRSFYFRSNIELAMLDTSVGYYVVSGTGLYKTTDGGYSFNSLSLPAGISYISILKRFIPNAGDTLLVYAGSTGTLNRFLISSDRGNTWTTSTIGSYDLINWDGYITGINCLGLDTFATINNRGDVFLTLNNGLSWQKKATTLNAGRGVFVNSPGHLFALGASAEGKAMVSVSNDLGNTWYSFVSPYNGAILNMAMIGENVALLTGTDGLILKWYMRDILLTSITSISGKVPSYKVYPNPASTALKIDAERVPSDLSYSIYTTLGQTIQSGRVSNKNIDVSALKSGLYFIVLSGEGEKGRELRFVKE